MDADGLTAGALAFRARAEPADAALLLERGRTPWSEALPAGRVAILDWGMRALDPPALIVDDHAPEAEPADGQLPLSGFGGRRETTTAALVRRLVPEQPAWLAAVGAVGHRGFALPECAGAPRTTVRKLVPLVNAPRLARSLPLWAPVGRRARRGLDPLTVGAWCCAHTHVGGAARHGRDGYRRARDRPADVSMLAFLRLCSAEGLSRPSDVEGGRRIGAFAAARADRGVAGRRARGKGALRLAGAGRSPPGEGGIVLDTGS